MCCVTLGRVLTWVVNPDWFVEIVNCVFKPPQPHLSYVIAIFELLQYSSTLGVPESAYAWFDIISDNRARLFK